MIEIGGESFVDISDLVAVFPYRRAQTWGLVQHHSVGGAADLDLNLSGSTIDEELAEIVKIDRYHREVNGWEGFGYQAIGFPLTGHVYVVGDGGDQRAHVGGKNHLYEGFVLAGNYDKVPVPDILVRGVARWVKAKWRQRGTIPLVGHGTVTAGTIWASSCPGQFGRLAIPQIIELAKGDDMPDPRVDDLMAVMYGRWDGQDQAMADAIREAGGVVPLLKRLLDAGAPKLSDPTPGYPNPFSEDGKWPGQP